MYVEKIISMNLGEKINVKFKRKVRGSRVALAIRAL